MEASFGHATIWQIPIFELFMFLFQKK